MNPEQENFESLRRLLALKRHEQPPPGYFDTFSQQVIDRIRAVEHIDEPSIFDALSWEAPWLQRLWRALDTRPVFAGAFGAAVCGSLVAGVVLSEKTDIPQAMVISEPPRMVNVAEGTAKPFEPGPVTPVSAVAGSLVPAKDSLFLQLKGAPKPQVQLLGLPGQ